jgi:hypothetical protein
VLRQFAQDKSCADEHIRKRNEISEAAYQNAIESVQSILNNSDASLTDGHIHHSVDDLYDKYFIKKSISFPNDPMYLILDFTHNYVVFNIFVTCFKLEGIMHSLILDLKCYLLRKS